MKQRTGYLFRRKGGKHITIDDPRHQDARIYLCYMVNYERKTVSLGTSNKRSAEIKAGKLMGGMAYSDHESYLMHLIEMGEMAKRELAGEQGQHLRTPLNEVYENYLASKERPKSGQKTLNQYGSTWNRFTDFLPASVQFIEDVTKEMCSSYIDNLEAELKWATCDKHLGQLKTIFRVISTGTNPWSNLQIMKANDSTPHRRLDINEVRELVKQAPTAEQRLLIQTSYYCGLRLTHACHLRIEQLDFKAGLYSFRKSDYKENKEVPPVMPIHPAYLKDIQAYLKTTGIKKGYLFPSIARDYDDESKNPSRDDITPIFKKAKVKASPEGSVGLHSLRVTYDSMLEDASVSHTIVKYLMGHSLGKIHKTYTRLEVAKIRPKISKAIPAL